MGEEIPTCSNSALAGDRKWPTVRNSFFHKIQVSVVGRLGCAQLRGPGHGPTHIYPIFGPAYRCGKCNLKYFGNKL